jgi:hypothetical protein
MLFALFLLPSFFRSFFLVFVVLDYPFSGLTKPDSPSSRNLSSFSFEGSLPPSSPRNIHDPSLVASSAPPFFPPYNSAAPPLSPHHPPQYLYPPPVSMNVPFILPSLSLDPMHPYAGGPILPPMNLYPPPPLFSVPPPPFPSVLPPSSLGYDHSSSYYQPVVPSQQQYHLYQRNGGRGGGGTNRSSSMNRNPSSFNNKYYHSSNNSSSSSSTSRNFSPRTYGSSQPQYEQVSSKNGDVLPSFSQDDEAFAEIDQQRLLDQLTGKSYPVENINLIRIERDENDKLVPNHLTLKNSCLNEELERKMMGNHEKKEQKELKSLQPAVDPLLLLPESEKKGSITASIIPSSSVIKGVTGRDHTGSHRDRSKIRARKGKSQDKKETRNKQHPPVKLNLEADFPTLVNGLLLPFCFLLFTFYLRMLIIPRGVILNLNSPRSVSSLSVRSSYPFF